MLNATTTAGAQLRNLVIIVICIADRKSVV